MSTRNVLNSPRLTELKKRRRRVFFNRALLYFFVFIAVVALATFLSRVSGLNISTVEAEGNTIIDTERIRAIAEEEISGKYVWLFPKRNIFLYSKSAIREALIAEHPRLKDINMSVGTDRTLRISVAEREPLYTWCGTMIDTGDDEQCYFLDKEGYIFDEAPYFSGDVYFRFYGALDDAGARVQGQYFQNKHFAGLAGWKESIEALGLKPVALYLKPDGDAETYLNGSGMKQPKILLRTGADTSVLAENLRAALATEPLQTRIKKEYAKLEYLDLRFENKVVSKFATE